MEDIDYRLYNRIGIEEAQSKKRDVSFCECEPGVHEVIGSELRAVEVVNHSAEFED